jgi:hypothetical protein
MDIYEWFIANLHQWLGHDRTAAYLGVPPRDRGTCKLCNPELNRKPPIGLQPEGN